MLTSLVVVISLDAHRLVRRTEALETRLTELHALQASDKGLIAVSGPASDPAAGAPSELTTDIRTSLRRLNQGGPVRWVDVRSSIPAGPASEPLTAIDIHIVLQGDYPHLMQAMADAFARLEGGHVRSLSLRRVEGAPVEAQIQLRQLLARGQQSTLAPTDGHR